MAHPFPRQQNRPKTATNSLTVSKLHSGDGERGYLLRFILINFSKDFLKALCQPL